MSNLELANSFFDALEANRIDEAMAALDDDVAVWHNYDMIDQAFENLLPGFDAIHRCTKDFAYIDRVYVNLPDGAVLQHSLSVTLPDIGKIVVPMMVRMFARDGRITRFEEYLDQRSMVPLVKAITPADLA